MARTTTKSAPPPPPQGPILDTALKDALGERYLAYALSTITSRSLPDVRDGLKPVHRRLLYAMRVLKLDPASGFKKCARVVGDVIGKYHPHGDQSVYDALVRLAQDFAARYPLVDGQGNFGNIDGDNAAAMRYTESRMTAVAEALLDGIEDDAVDFRPTYDGSEEEPVVLPARFPNLLANGSNGIAVGMATSIPPHNVDEICAALLYLIKTPKASIAKLVDFMPGPDFPTGGILVEPRASIEEAYATGRGAFRLRARWAVEKLGNGQYQIVVTEIPYQVQKAKLVERIADLLNNKKLPLVDDVRDESAEDVRLVLVPKSGKAKPAQVMETLFRATDLESRISLNMNVLADGRTPKVMNLREVLQSFLDHRHVVLVRTSEYRLKQIDHRLEVLGGYLIAYLNLDRVIQIIREEDEPKPALIKAFKLTDVQAEAILNMRLRALRKLEEMEIRGEHDKLSAERKGLAALLQDEDQRWAFIADEVKDIRKKFGAGTKLGKRRTEVGDAPATVEVPLEELVEKEPITILCSEKGWIRVQKGHVEESDDVKYKDGDKGRFWLHAQSTDKLQIFATNGRFYTIACDRLPRGRGFGEPLRLFIDLGNEDDMISLMVHDPARKLLLVARDGRGFIVPEGETLAQTKGGRRVLSLKDGGEAQVCTPVSGDSIALVGENRKLLVFALKEVPEMEKGRGVTLMRFKDGGLEDAKTFSKKDGLTWTSGARTFTLAGKELTLYAGERGQAGRIVPKGFPKNNKFDA